jgi:hypothetical protein
VNAKEKGEDMIPFFAVILVLFLSLGISANALGQPDLDAIKSLKMIEAKAKVGASYDDYTEELATTKYKVNLFIQSTNAKNELKLTEAIKKAMEHYDFAKLVWERAKNRKEMESELYRIKTSLEWNPIKKRKAKIESRKELQEDEKLRSMGKSTYYLDKTKDSDILQRVSALYLNKFFITKQETYIDEILPIIWGQASNEIKNATSAFQKQSQALKEADSENKLEENSLVTEDSPVRIPRRWRRTRSKAIQPPPAPPALGQETPEPLPASGSVMRMVNPETRDQD